MTLQTSDQHGHHQPHQQLLHAVGALLNPATLATVRQRIEQAAQAFIQVEHLDAATAAQAALGIEHALDVLRDVARGWKQGFAWHHATRLGWPPPVDRLDVCLTELIAAARNVVVACEIKHDANSAIPTVWAEIGEIHKGVENHHHASTRRQVADLTLEKCRSVIEVTDRLEKHLHGAVFIRGLSADSDGVGVVIEGAAYFALDVAFTSTLLRHVLNETDE